MQQLKPQIINAVLKGSKTKQKKQEAFEIFQRLGPDAEDFLRPHRIAARLEVQPHTIYTWLAEYSKLLKLTTKAE